MTEKLFRSKFIERTFSFPNLFKTIFLDYDMNAEPLFQPSRSSSNPFIPKAFRTNYTNIPHYYIKSNQPLDTTTLFFLHVFGNESGYFEILKYPTWRITPLYAVILINDGFGKCLIYHFSRTRKCVILFHINGFDSGLSRRPAFEVFNSLIFVKYGRIVFQRRAFFSQPNNVNSN